MAFELDSDLEARARRLAERTGESVSEALRRALDERLARLDAPVPEPESGTTQAADGLTQGPGFEIRLLGHPVIRRVDVSGEAAEVSWRLRRSLWLVAYLALAPEHRASKDELVASLWPDASAGAVRRNFHPTVSDARRTLAGGSDLPTLAHRDGVYLLDPAVPWWIDVDAFAHCVQRAEAVRGEDGEGELEHLRAAWSLVRAPLLMDHDAEWIEGPREAIRRRWLEVLRRIGELAAGLDRPTLALDAWRRLLMEEPFEEQAHLEVMELYGRQGRRDLVRRQYVRLQELLAELEVEPATETQERYLELMR